MTDKKSTPRAIELLAPARDAETAIAAISHGADAVYMGAGAFGARAAATNSLDDIARVVEFAHRFDARVYVTVNTIIYDNELEAVTRLISDLYKIGVDALIVQDTAILEMDIPPIQLHASTQMDTRTPEKAAWLGRSGFSQIVVARESSLSDISSIAAATTARIEAFVHGALCVSYSGDCQAGWMTAGRSANRGECPQVCRYRFNLTDADGNILVKGKHLLSLRDLNLSSRLADLLDAGVSSLKIEGRLKDSAYVRNAVAAYRAALDRIISQYPDRYRRASAGTVKTTFTPRLSKGFNRGFTTYFLDGSNPGQAMASLDTPKMSGERAGIVTDINGCRLKIRADVELHNGDGIGYFDRNEEFTGVRVNRVEGNRVFINRPVDIRRGTVIYRNRDKQHDDIMAGETATRTIGLNMTLRPVGDDNSRVALSLSDERGCSATIVADIDPQPAKSPQQEARLRVFSKLGDTIYHLDSFDDTVGNLFIPASALTSLRRRAIEALDSAHRATFDRLKPAPKEYTPVPGPLTRHDNVSNRLAMQFYRKCGATTAPIPLAAEVTPRFRSDSGMTVMTTRYCVRRELGYCLKTSRGRSWHGPLYLTSGSDTFRLDFDCAACRMKVVANPGKNS